MQHTKRLLLTMAVILMAACRTQGPAPMPLPPDTSNTAAPTLLGVAWDDRAPFRSGLIPGEQGVLDELPAATAYQIDLQIADDLTRLDARQEVRYTNAETVDLNEVYFRLFPNLFGAQVRLGAVQVDGREVKPDYALLDSALRVPLSPPLRPAETALVSLGFSVTVPTSPGGSYGAFAFADGILALAHFYPIIPVYDDEGWNLELPPPYGDLVYADSSFYLVRVTAPAALQLAASGVRVERQVADDRQQVTYAAGPVRDFYLAGSTRYAVVSEQVGATTVNSYALHELLDDARVVLGYAVNALRAFNQRFGTYPFTELDVVSTPTSALGIEYPGIFALAVRLYGSSSEYPQGYLESTAAHEAAHQWFYGTVGNDQLDEPWLDEALAQYATLLYWQDLYGPSGAQGFRSSLQERWARVENADIPIGKPVRAYSSKEYGAIVYGRGPLFIEELASRMGQSVFDAFLCDYYARYQWGIATADAFQELAEQHCACDLSALFDAWVR
jgi:hypothetical protein